MEGPTRTVDVEEAQQRGIEGGRISREQEPSLVEYGELPHLLEAAPTIRDRSKGRTVSYSKKVFIPLTHLCRDYCGYCTFQADPSRDRASYLTPQHVLAVADAGRRTGCKEALFGPGDQPEKVFPEARLFLQKLDFESTHFVPDRAGY